MRNASVAAVRFVAEVAAVLVSVCAVCAGLLWLALWLLGIVFVWLPRLFLRTAVLGAVLAAAGCATMANGAVQRISVTSDPPGALENGPAKPGWPGHSAGAGVGGTSPGVLRFGAASDASERGERQLDGLAP